jgi:glycerol-3-phosphate cytidylyltransferase
MKKVITFGSFDLFHIGHLRILERAKEQGDYLIVGVSSDELNTQKGKTAIFPLSERLEIIKSLKCVDEVFIEETLEQKDEYIKKYDAHLLIMGDDWKDKFNWVSCPVLYLDRTPDISTTYIKNTIGMIYKNK